VDCAPAALLNTSMLASKPVAAASNLNMRIVSPRKSSDLVELYCR
jgi:hypothetical protein